MATGTPAHEFRELDNAELQSRLKDAKDCLLYTSPSPRDS